MSLLRYETQVTVWSRSPSFIELIFPPWAWFLSGRGQNSGGFVGLPALFIDETPGKVTDSSRVVLQRDRFYLLASVLGWQTNDRQMLSWIYCYSGRIKETDHLFHRHQSRSAKKFTWKTRTSRVNIFGHSFFYFFPLNNFLYAVTNSILFYWRSFWSQHIFLFCVRSSPSSLLFVLRMVIFYYIAGGFKDHRYSIIFYKLFVESCFTEVKHDIASSTIWHDKWNTRLL